MPVLLDRLEHDAAVRLQVLRAVEHDAKVLAIRAWACAQSAVGDESNAAEISSAQSCQ